MLSLIMRPVFSAAFISCAAAVLAQEPESDAGSERASNDRAAAVEKCFLTSAVMDMNVMSDEHIYVRTRGGNHYLVTVQRCRNLRRSYNSNEVRLVPYGRRVCQNDGSYLAYNARGRDSVCPILTIDSVEDRAEAQSIAAGNRSSVEVTVPDD